jgi:hypothetical protein
VLKEAGEEMSGDEIEYIVLARLNKLIEEANKEFAPVIIRVTAAEDIKGEVPKLEGFTVHAIYRHIPGKNGW